MGLATFAISVRAADYDLEPLMRRYGEPNQNVTAEDDNTAPETMQPIDRHPATQPVGSGVNQVAPAIFSSTEDDSAQADQSATPPGHATNQSVRALPRNATAAPGMPTNIM